MPQSHSAGSKLTRRATDSSYPAEYARFWSTHRPTSGAGYHRRIIQLVKQQNGEAGHISIQKASGSLDPTSSVYLKTNSPSPRRAWPHLPKTCVHRSFTTARSYRSLTLIDFPPGIGYSEQRHTLVDSYTIRQKDSRNSLDNCRKQNSEQPKKSSSSWCNSNATQTRSQH